MGPLATRATGAPGDRGTYRNFGVGDIDALPNSDFRSRQDLAKPYLVVLSSSLLTERMLLHSSFLDTIQNRAELEIWTAADPDRLADSSVRDVLRAMPKIDPFPEFPYAYLRRLDDFAWDARLKTPSRASMMQHVRRKTLRPSIRALQGPALLMSALRLEEPFERWLERVLLSRERSPEATERLIERRPTAVIATGPQRFEEPAVIAAAKRAGIPTLALITSWDNISTKNRMPFSHDGYLVWSERMKDELRECYPYTRNRPVYVVGAPQFDAFFQKDIKKDRLTFCNSVGLKPEFPIVLYALGSPNFLKEHHGAVALAERIQRGELGNVQLLVRPHPVFDNGDEARAFDRFGERVRVQRTGLAGSPIAGRSQSYADIVEWVNTFYHADVVVNLSSTATVDAAICNRPIVNLDYDPEPGQPNSALVKDVNHLWTHFRPIVESGGVSLTNSLDETVQAIRVYLSNPALHAERRRWIAEYVCGFVDGRCGERLAEAMLDFVGRRAIPEMVR
jgi:hypothetical protein